MPTLNEYLGTIVSSISNARVMSDIQAVKIAEEYEKHRLLKHFAVPRMRIADVEVEFNVAIDEMDEEIIYPVDIIKNKELNKQLYAEVTKSLGVRSLPKALSRQVQNTLSERTKTLETKLNQTKKMSQIQKFGEVVSNDIQLLMAGEEQLNQGFDANFLRQRLNKVTDRTVRNTLEKNTLGNLQVIAESSDIKEIQAENLLKIKMKVTEDGMEWAQSEDADGNVTKHLLPE